MPQTFAQRVTLILPLVGVALLLAAMILFLVCEQALAYRLSYHVR